MTECIDNVLKENKNAMSKQDAVEILDEYSKFIEEQRAQGNPLGNLSGDEQFAKHLAKKSAQKKWSWLNDKVVLNNRANEIDFTSKQTIGKSFDEVNRSVQKRITQNQKAEFSKFAQDLSPEDRLIYKSKKYNREQVGKILGDLMVPEEEIATLPKITDYPAEFAAEYRIAEAMSKRYRAIHAEKNALGANTGFLKGYIGRNNYDQLAYATPEQIQSFKKDALERFNWDEMYLEGKTREQYIDRLVDKVRNGLYDSHVDELQYYDEIEQAKKSIRDFAQGSLAERLGRQRFIQMKPEDALYMHKKYGNGDIDQIFKKELESWGKSKALLQTFGSNPEKNYKKWVKGIVENSTEYGSGKTHFIEKRSTNYLDYLLGRLNQPGSNLTKRVFNTARTFESALHLGTGLLTSLADIATPGLRKSLVYMEDSIGGNLRIATESMAEQFAMLTGNYGDEVAKKIVKAQVEELEDALFDFHYTTRFGGDVLGLDEQGRQTGGVFNLLNVMDDAHHVAEKFNFIDWWTSGAIRRQYAPIAREFGEFADTGFDALPDFFKQHLKNHSLENDWETIRAFKIVSEDGRSYIDPKAFDNISTEELQKYYPNLKAQRSIANKKEELSSLLKTAFSKEAETRVIMPDVTTSVNVAGGLKKGSLKDELVSSLFQFKSYPIAMWKLLIAPAFSQGIPTIAAFTAFSMGTNMMITWANDFLNNKTPRPFVTSDDVGIDTVAQNWTSLLTRSIGYPFVDELLPKVASGDFKTSDLVSLGGPLFGDTAKTLSNLSSISAGIQEQDGGKIGKGATRLVAGAPVIGPALRGNLLTKSLSNFWINNTLETFSPGWLTQQERYKEEQGSQSIIE